MPIKVECTGCGSTLRVPDEMLGRKVRCPKCQETFTAAEPESAPPPPPPREEVRDDPPPRPKARDYDDEQPVSRSSRSRGKNYDDEEDDRPSSRRRDDDDRPSRRGDDDDDDRPSRRRALADDDDDHDRAPRRGGRGEKPSSVQTAGILMLIGGILACLSALYISFSFLVGSMGICCLYPSYIYSLVVGIMAIIRGSALLGENAYKAGPSTGIAIMMIVNIVNFDIFTMGLGIVALVMLNQEDSERDFGG